MKKCSYCGVLKPTSHFAKRSIAADGLNANCKPCRNERNKDWRKRNPDRVRQYNSRRVYSPEHEQVRWLTRRYSKHGITADIFERILQAQDGKCAICRKRSDKTFRVDHDHSCCSGAGSCGNCIRGLLCEKCNPALGGFNDDPVLLRAAAEYLETYSAGSRRPIILSGTENISVGKQGE